MEIMGHNTSYFRDDSLITNLLLGKKTEKDSMNE